MRDELYRAALRLIEEHGYEGATLRDVANEVGVSPGLLYRYYPSKEAVVLRLYDELSVRYADRMAESECTTWVDRAVFGVRCSIGVLSPHRNALVALVPILVGDAEYGLFSPRTSFSRERVQGAFVEAVRGASDAPEEPTCTALGNVLYMLNLLVILWWLLDRSEGQSATRSLIRLMEQRRGVLSLLMKLSAAGVAVQTANDLIHAAFFEFSGRGDTAA